VARRRQGQLFHQRNRRGEDDHETSEAIDVGR
jgi:hypothetical protein